MAPRIDILTLFPDVVTAYLDSALLGAAREKGLLEVGVTDMRDFATTRYRSVDDAPYGGGDGMVLRCEPVVAAVEAVKRPESRVIATSPRGAVLDQARVTTLAGEAHLVLLCGRYAGFDQRILEETGAEELSIGDYVLSGGELAALALTEAISRWVPGVLGNPDSVRQDSFAASPVATQGRRGSRPGVPANSTEGGILEHPVYTRPPVFRGRAVPEVLLSGDHAAIEQYRRRQALWLTRERRPDLLERLERNELSEEDRRILRESEDEQA